jgi:hypothetical protein
MTAQHSLSAPINAQDIGFLLSHFLHEKNVRFSLEMSQVQAILSELFTADALPIVAWFY